MELNGLKQLLVKFDEHGWKGSFSNRNWKIANGGYDLWFELYYNDQPVAQCINGKLSSYFGLEKTDKNRLLSKILEVYEHLTLNSEEEWEEVNHKMVQDSDGFMTDYTLYRNEGTGQYICVFGDKELYEPSLENADHVTDNENEVIEWFDSYNGFEEENSLDGLEQLRSLYYELRGVEFRTRDDFVNYVNCYAEEKRLIPIIKTGHDDYVMQHDGEEYTIGWTRGSYVYMIIEDYVRATQKLKNIEIDGVYNTPTLIKKLNETDGKLIDMDDEEKIALAKDENTSVNILMELSEDKNELVRQAVAGNSSCIEEVLVDLTADENDSVYRTAMETLKKKKSGLEEKIRDCEKMSEKNKKGNHSKNCGELEK